MKVLCREIINAAITAGIVFLTMLPAEIPDVNKLYTAGLAAGVIFMSRLALLFGKNQRNNKKKGGNATVSYTMDTDTQTVKANKMNTKVSFATHLNSDNNLMRSLEGDDWYFNLLSVI